MTVFAMLNKHFLKYIHTFNTVQKQKELNTIKTSSEQTC